MKILVGAVVLRAIMSDTCLKLPMPLGNTKLLAGVEFSSEEDGLEGTQNTACKPRHYGASDGDGDGASDGDGDGESENESLEAEEGPSTDPSLRFSLDALQFAVEGDWSLVALSEEAKEQFYAVLELKSGCVPEGANLRELLCRTEAAWSTDLPPRVNVALGGDRIFLPWDLAKKGLGMGWSVYVLQSGKNLFSVSLTPALSPGGEAKLAENSLSFDGAGLQEIVRELFLRTQQQEARFQYFVRHLPGAHFKQDSAHCFTLINSALEELLGSDLVRELGEGTEWLDWVHPGDRNEVLANLKRCKGVNLPTSCRFRLLLPNGDRVLHLMELRIPVRGIDGSLNGYEGLWLDLTREELAQQQLQHSAWKDSLAQISGSLSHDFNNLLAGLVSLSELLIMDLEETDSNYEIATLIKTTTNQAKDLSGRIISLNREERGRPDLQSLSQLVREQLDLLRIVLPKDATLDVAIPRVEFPVRVDVVSMRRILVNFATNARDVLDYKGKVALKMREIDLASFDRSCLVSNHCKREGKGVEFVFEDNGPGIPPEIISRIFGAYFSTKDCSTSSGSGLGLYCLTQFARENNFDYGVRTRMGEGTEMVLVFPLISEDDAFLDEVEGEVNFAEIFKEPPVAIYGAANAATNAVVAGLERKSISVKRLAYEAELKDWLSEETTQPRTLLMAFAYHEQSKARRVCESIEVDSKNLQTVLSLQGLNPDHFSDLIEHKFDLLMMANAKPSVCVTKIVNHLSIIKEWKCIYPV
jgi:signal transduction histidine kinase